MDIFGEDQSGKVASGRRAFLKTAAAASALAMTGTGSATAQAAAPVSGKLRIGVVGVVNSFTAWSWSDLIEPDKEGNNPRGGSFKTPFLGMDITHVWDPDTKAAQEYAQRLDAASVAHFDDMVGEVDGVIFGVMEDVPWYKHLARPFIEAGTPVYLSRPFAYCLRDIDEILDLVAKHNTPIIATAKFEHYNEVAALRRRLGDLGKLRLVHATGNANDYPMHFHIMFMMMQILGFDVKQVSLITDGIKRNNFCQLALHYPGNDEQPPFLCAIHGVRNKDQLSVSMFGDTHTVTTNMMRSPDWQDSLLFRYAPQVIAMQRTFEGKSFEPLENIRAKTRIWLAAYYSHLERNGGLVDVADLPPDWRAPYPQPDRYDEKMFR